MPIDLSKMTEAGQKEYSRLLKDLKYHRTTVEKCQKVTKESPSDKVLRAIDGVKYHKNQVELHDSIISTRIEKAIAKITAEGKADKEDKLRYLKDAEEKLDNLQAIKSRQQVSAEIEIAKLEASIESLTSIYDVPAIPLTQVPRTSSLSPEQEAAFQAMKADEAELESLRAARGNPTTSWATPIHKSNTTYGPVSELSKAKIPVKSIKRLGDAVNLYSQEITD